MTVFVSTMDASVLTTGSVTYQCPVPYCERHFTGSYALAEHLKVHAGEKRHICPVRTCGRRFSTPGNLSRHKRLHGPIKPLECPVAGCICTFRSENKLSKHMKFHLGSPVHVCPSPGCGKTFSTAGNLNRHVKGHHPTFDARKVKLVNANLKALRAGENHEGAFGSPTSVDTAPRPPTTLLTLTDAASRSPSVASSTPSVQTTTETAVGSPVAAGSGKSLAQALDPEQLDVLVSILNEDVKAEPESFANSGITSETLDCATTGRAEPETKQHEPVSVLDDMIRFHMNSLEM